MSRDRDYLARQESYSGRSYGGSPEPNDELQFADSQHDRYAPYEIQRIAPSDELQSNSPPTTIKRPSIDPIAPLQFSKLENARRREISPSLPNERLHHAKSQSLSSTYSVEPRLGNENRYGSRTPVPSEGMYGSRTPDPNPGRLSVRKPVPDRRSFSARAAAPEEVRTSVNEHRSFSARAAGPDDGQTTDPAVQSFSPRTPESDIGRYDARNSVSGHTPWDTRSENSHDGGYSSQTPVTDDRRWDTRAPATHDRYDIQTPATHEVPYSSHTPVPEIRRWDSQTPAPPHVQHLQSPPASLQRRDIIDTGDDINIANQIISRNKGLKIESRNKLTRALTRNPLKVKANMKEVYQALASVVNGHENVGPGVVDVLQQWYIDLGGDVNYVPGQTSKLKMFKKSELERTGLLEAATIRRDVDVVRILAAHSDKIGLNKSLDIVLRNRNGRAGDPYIRPEEQMIQIFISKGADGSHNISTAVSAGDETLLQMLLDGPCPIQVVSEALPTAITYRDPDIRKRLTRMLLTKSADVTYNGGAAMFEATRLFDMAILNMLLDRRPHPPSLNRAFYTALNLTNSNTRYEACEKLIQAGAVGEEVSKGLTIAVTTEHQNVEFLKIILVGASVDYQDGHAVCLAIENDHQPHLRLMLERRANEKTFDKAFVTAMRLRNPRDQLKYCHILVSYGPPRDSCSKALLESVKTKKEELCKVFLEKGASVDFEGGAAITAAAMSDNLVILELLIGGLFQKPANSSLVAAFGVAISLSASQKKMKLLKLILDAGFRGPQLDSALVGATKQGAEGQALCKLLLQYGASVNSQGGEALDAATSSGDLELMNILLDGPQRPAVEGLSKIFETAIRLPPNTRPQAVEIILKAGMPISDQVAAAVDRLVQDRKPDIETIKVLLAYRASVHYEKHRPLVLASRASDKDLLTLLLDHSRDDSAASAVFDVMMKTNGFWSSSEAFSILEILLDHGAEGDAVNDALIRVIADTKPTSRHFEVTLLQHRVDINYKDGEALQIATERGEPALVRRMLSMGPSADSVSMAFPFAFFTKLGHASTLAVIQAFVDIAGADLDPDFMHPTIPEPPVFLCLHHFPTNKGILEATLQAGFHVDQTMTTQGGKLTPLYWALSEQGKRTADDLIEFLITERADLHNHPEALLNLAIANGRHNIVKLLIKAGADINLPNEDNVTPLSLAIQLNDVESTQALVEAGVNSNDGSLHDAARMANPDIIKLLLDHGHDANFPCIRLGGRPPLFELCLNSPNHLRHTQGTIQQKEQIIKRSIQTLINGGAFTNSRLPQAGNRSLLHHALDSISPHLTTKALLETAQIFQDINKDYNLYTDGKYTYSPTQYIARSQSRGDTTQSQSLLTLLTSFHCTDRFWKNDGMQPFSEMMSPPAHIELFARKREADALARAEAEEAQRLEIERQQAEIDAARRKIALEAEAEQAIRDRAERNHRQRLEQEARVHAAFIAKENDRLRVKETADAHALRQAASMSKLRNDENESKYRREMRLLGEKKALATSEAALGWAYNKGMEDSGMGMVGQGRKMLGDRASRSNLNLGNQRMMRIEGPRIKEVDEDSE